MAGEGKRRIVELPEATTVSSEDYFAIDSGENGTKKIKKPYADTETNVNRYNVINYLLGQYRNASTTTGGITYTWDAPDCKVAGTANGVAISNIFIGSTNFPPGVSAGDTVYIDYESAKVKFQVYNYVNGSLGSMIYDSIHSGFMSIPSNSSGLLCRFRVESGTTCNETVSISMTNCPPVEKILGIINTRTKRDVDDYLRSIDLDNVKTSGTYFLIDSQSYQHMPDNSEAGVLIVSTPSTALWQIFIPWTYDGMYFRRQVTTSGSGFSEWRNLSANQYTNNYTFNEYSNTYTVTATPTITSDTNNYLSSTGDTTDVTASIAAMLSQTKICRLGPGVFYVKDLQMPNDSMLCGSGKSTRLIRSGTDAGYAVKMGQNCIIKDMSIVGSNSWISATETLGNRHGILWQGDYTESSDNSRQPQHGIIENVYLNGWTGGGITFYDTGYGLPCLAEVCNVYAWNCSAGINVSYWSEFHKFTNIHTNSCYYGCINNGGNNIFVNCDFSGSTVGYLMDNSTGQSRNNSHGSAIGCVFNHSGSNSGIGVKILNCDNGFIFDGCQIFYSQIVIDDSDGVVFSNCNMGADNVKITISGGGTVLFNGNIHQAQPTKSITNNNNVHFANCYVRATGEAVTN